MAAVAPIEQYRQSSTVSFKYALGDIGIYPKMFHQHHEIFLLLRGNVEYIGETSRSFIPPNTLVLIPQGIYHQFIVRGDISEYERCVLEISPAYKPAEHFQNVLQHQTLFQLTADSGILDSFFRLRKYIGEPYADDYPYLAEAVTAEILSLLRHERLHSPVNKVDLNPLSLKAMEYIHAHLDQPLSLRKLADACFVSSSALSHTFRKSYGISVMQYVQNKKMTMAKHYILNGNSPGDVCRMCGYTEYSTFYRAYIKEYGCPPTQDGLDGEKR